jgi:hypothetical protein
MSKSGFTEKVDANGLSSASATIAHQRVNYCSAAPGDPKCDKMHIVELNRVKTLYIYNESQYS